MTHSRFYLPALILLSLLFNPVPVKAIEILVLPSVIDQRLDAWKHVPAGSEPTLYPAERIYRKQSFRLLILGKDYATDSQNNANMSYTVQVFDPNGAALLGQGAAMELFNGRVSTPSSLLLSRQYLTLDFSETDPFGTYRFQVKARDILADLETTASADLVLAPVDEHPAFDSKEEFSEWLTNYYRAPDPARAVTALLQYVDTETTTRMKQIPLLTFLTMVFENNPFLWPHLKRLYTAAERAEQEKILLLSAMTGQKDDSFFSSLDPELSAFYLDALKISLPVPTERPVTELEINSLWAEFMATGTIAPIRKLIGALYLETTRGTQDRLASGSLEMTPDVKALLDLETVYQLALGTLIYNGEQHSLVKQYIGYIYEFENPEPVIKSQLEEILEILQQRSNEEEARKHMENQGKEP